MARDGKRRPPRPRIEVLSPSPSEQEGAAIAAAIERFLADTVPTPAPERERMSPWQRAGLLEGVGARGEAMPAWGDPSPWHG